VKGVFAAAGQGLVGNMPTFALEIPIGFGQKGGFLIPQIVAPGSGFL
jgi:hypothetical protein